MGPTVSAAVRAMTRISVSNRPPEPRRPARQRGFTLLEILLVLALLALASVMVVPNVGSLDARTYSVQLRQVNALLHYARRNAVITGLPVSARLYGPSFRPDDAEIASADEFTGGQERGQGQSAGLLQTPEARWESDGIALSYEDSTERLTEVERFIDVTFYPEGGSSGGTLIFSRDGRHTRIVIDPFTGRISSEETHAPI